MSIPAQLLAFKSGVGKTACTRQGSIASILFRLPNEDQATRARYARSQLSGSSKPDAPVEDDFNLIDIAPFVLTTAAREGVIRYELKDALITIEGGVDISLATAYDYDIFKVSYLAEQVRDCRVADKKGLRPSLPVKTYRSAATEIFKFCRRKLASLIHQAVHERWRSWRKPAMLRMFRCRDQAFAHRRTGHAQHNP